MDVHAYEPPDALTPTQVRVLEALSRGLGDNGAADVLGVTTESVKTSSQLARRKLKAKNTTHACCEALRQGLIR
jgi:DNA-binding NarL/FixJ family response regulator